MSINKKEVKDINNEFDDFVDYISELNITDYQRKVIIEYVNDLLYLNSRYHLYETLLKAAKRDINAMLAEDKINCKFCANHKDCTRTKESNVPCPAEWRGLCPENAKDRDK